MTPPLLWVNNKKTEAQGEREPTVRLAVPCASGQAESSFPLATNHPPGLPGKCPISLIPRGVINKSQRGSSDIRCQGSLMEQVALTGPVNAPSPSTVRPTLAESPNCC